MQKWRWTFLLFLFVIFLWLWGGLVFELARPGLEGDYVKQEIVGDYTVTLETMKPQFTDDEEIKVWGTVTYTGLKPITKIYNSGMFFTYQIRGVDNDFKSDFYYQQPLIPKKLLRNVSETQILPDFNQLDLSPGKYVLEAQVSFSIGSVFHNHEGKDVEIPIHLSFEIVESE